MAREAYSLAYIEEFPAAYKTAYPMRLKRARKLGEDDGHQAGFLLAKIGKKEPEKDRVSEVATKEAEEKFPSNAAIEGAGTDEERQEYVQGFVSQFPVGYRKAN